MITQTKVKKYKPWHWTAETAGFGILHSRLRTRAPRESLMQPILEKLNYFEKLFQTITFLLDEMSPETNVEIGISYFGWLFNIYFI